MRVSLTTLPEFILKLSEKLRGSVNATFLVRFSSQSAFISSVLLSRRWEGSLTKTWL